MSTVGLRCRRAVDGQLAIVPRAIDNVADEAAIQLEVRAVRRLRLRKSRVTVQEHASGLHSRHGTLVNLEQRKLAVEVTVAVTINATTKEQVRHKVESATRKERRVQDTRRRPCRVLTRRAVESVVAVPYECAVRVGHETRRIDHKDRMHPHVSD